MLLENLFILLPPSEEEDDRGLEANQGSGHSPTRRPHIANASILGSQRLYFDLNHYFEQVTAMDVTIVLNAMLLSLSPLSGPSASTATSGKVVLPKPPLPHPTPRCHRGS